MNENLASNLLTVARLHPERASMRLDDAVTTYAELDAAAARVAGLLRDLRIDPGARVALMLPNVPAFAAAYYGALRVGAIVVPVNPQLTKRELAFCLGDCGAEAILTWHDCAEVAAAAAQEAGAACVRVTPGDFERLLAATEPYGEPHARAADDGAVILYTSGTTGRPKGALLTHANLARNAELACGLFALHDESVVLGALPLFHSFGQTCGLNAAVRVGACLTLVPRFGARRVLEGIDRDGVTVFQGVPTMCSSLVADPERERFDTSSLRVAVCGGAPLPVELLRAFEKAFGCPVMEGYGLSETSPMACFNPREGVRKPGSIGVPIPGVQMRIVDERREPAAPGEAGEIAIRGHNVMKGYWNRPAATAEAVDADGWFYSGDIGRTDADGYFYVVDRKKDMIIRGGFNVYPREIEEVLYEHPAVREAAVVGIPDARLGEEVGAAVVPAREVDAHELLEFLAARLAPYKRPRHVWFLSELPKGPTGKVLKREIARPATAPAQAIETETSNR